MTWDTSNKMPEPGVFTLSLDTELAWGMFDVDGVTQHEVAYQGTLDVVDRLCALFDIYDVPVTWALVAHLLRDCRGEACCSGRPSPSYDWVDDWFGSLPCRRELDPTVWYAPTLLDRLRGCAVDHDIGIHGDTHMLLGADGCSAAAAEAELTSAVETLREADIDPRSFVYPRNSVGHHRVLADHGIAVYRGPDARDYEAAGVPGPIKRLCRFLDERLERTPPVVTPSRVGGLVEIPGSQVFRPFHGGWQWTPPRSQVNRAHAGLERAAKTGGVFHLWFHPFNLALEPDRLLGRLAEILQRVEELSAAGRLEVLTMADVADAVEAGRWAGP